MADHMQFVTAKRRVKPIGFAIDDTEYEFNPPKQAGMVLPILDKAQRVGTPDENMVKAAAAYYDWFFDGLDEVAGKQIVARLSDPEDDFDTTNLDGIIEWCQKQVAGRPTT